ncbi:GAF and ANTAR domain-containing protein [Naasia lichenicola]|uniref:GAF and ANTAR domain-containing protein n=1 Tax=Naasia lichenicola TaxID=2565933 RepID=A0A4S4FUS8_9MICO|nr:GAF and ANTAR domain-containing protein [Naasia lichenicola]THG33376.1 GAF and ANTAR domain-containing protein [Naasia lichenicola]
MTEVSREAILLDALATLADTLVVGYDVVDLVQMLVETSTSLFDVDDAGLLLADDGGELDLLASTSEAGALIETIALSAESGPCIESFRTGKIVAVPDLRTDADAWGEFRIASIDAGFLSTIAVPLRLRDEVIGSLNFFRREPGELNRRDLRAAQAMADMAAIGILHERSLREGDAVRQQLQYALDSRVVIEQAKGVLAHTHDLGMDDAFATLRRYARSNRLTLREVAQGLVDRTLIF